MAYPEVKDGLIKVVVRTCAKKSEIICYDEAKKAYRLAIAARPEKGEANIAIQKFLSKELKKKVVIVSGFSSKIKILRIEPK